MEKLKWWGYVHTSGTVHLKRYFGPQDIDEAHESPFCAEVYGPFEADSHDDARYVFAMLRITRPCKECGSQIVAGSPHAQDKAAHMAGYCCFGCKEVHDKKLELMKEGKL